MENGSICSLTHISTTMHKHLLQKYQVPLTWGSQLFSCTSAFYGDISFVLLCMSGVPTGLGGDGVVQAGI